MRCMEDRLSVTLNKTKEDCSCVTLTRHNLRNCPKSNDLVEVWPFQPSAWDRRNNYVQNCSWTTDTLLVELRKSVTFDKNEGQRLCREVAGAPLLEAKEEDMTKILEDVRLYTVKKRKLLQIFLAWAPTNHPNALDTSPAPCPRTLAGLQEAPWATGSGELQKLRGSMRECISICLRWSFSQQEHWRSSPCNSHI